MSKLKAVKQTKYQKLFHKTPKIIEAKDGVITSVYRHRDKLIISVGDELLNHKQKQFITEIKADTRFSGNMSVVTSIDTGHSGIANIVPIPKMIFV